MKRLVIVGCGGHAKVITEIVEAINAKEATYELLGFVDDFTDCLSFMGYPVLGKLSALDALEAVEIVIAIGNNSTRRKLADSLAGKGFATLIHPLAYVSKRARIGRGSVIMAHALVNTEAFIGEHVIINSSAVVEHDNILGDFVHVSPGAILAGTVTIGVETHVGLGANVRQNIHIGNNVTIGAGAVVVKNIPDNKVAVGIPARWE